MADASRGDHHRITQALARIEVAIARRNDERAALQSRNARLRDELTEAVSTLDAILAEQVGTG